MLPRVVRAITQPTPTAPCLRGVSAAELLHREGAGRAFTERFIRPFFGGVFLDRSLEFDAGLLEFLFTMFARGGAAMPRQGMGEVSRALAAPLQPGTVRLRTPVHAIERAADGWQVRTAEGTVNACAVVLAVDGSAARGLAPAALSAVAEPAWRSTIQLAFDVPVAAVPASLQRAVLHLDGVGEGPVNHLVNISAAGVACAPAGHALVSANAVGVSLAEIGAAALERQARAQMARWFGADLHAWRLIRAQEIRHALPAQRPADLSMRPGVGCGDGLFLAGDWVTEGSIDAAMRSGRAAADAACRRLGR
jgi:phytoene dehydrogenase-like protein